jgi:ribosomal protein L25 (general stress protein Ctc)
MVKIMAVNLELAKRIKEISTPRQTREDVVEYYQEKYPGYKTDKKGNVTYEWKSKLVDDLQGFTTSKSGGLQSRASVARRFQTRGGKSWEDSSPSAKQREEYAALGEYLPKKPPSAVQVDGQVCVRYQDNPCEPRNISIILEGDEMKILLEQMDMQVIINKYMVVDLDDDEPTITECPCNGDYCECDFTITPIEDE